MIIDGHCHAGVGEGFTGPWDTRASLVHYLDRAREAGIERTVVFGAFHGDYALANRSVARLVRRFSRRLIGFVFVHAERDRSRLSEMVGQAVTEWGFRGIKVHGKDAPLNREVCNAARRFRVPILYDPVGNVHPVHLVAKEYPDVRFIIPHLGSFADDWRAHEVLIDLMTRLPNVYADTAGVRRFDYIEEAVRRAGPHKLIFGSDGPFLHPRLELEKLKLLDIGNRARARILGGNLQRLLGIPLPRSGWAACRSCGRVGCGRDVRCCRGVK